MSPDLQDHRAVQGRFLHALVAASASHRAIEETLSDWRAETRQASPGGARIVSHLRSALAMTRVLVMSLPREVGALPFGPLSARFALFALIVAVAANVYPLDRAWSYTILVTHPGPLWLPYFLTFLTTRALLPCLPLVWFYAAAWPVREPVSRTGLCVTMGISSVLLAGLAGFETSVFWSLISGAGLTPLGGEIVHIGRPILTFNFVQFYLAWVVGLGLLGTTVATASRTERWAWRVGLPIAFITVVFLFALHPVTAGWMTAGWVVGRLIGPSIWAIALVRLVRHGVPSDSSGVISA